MIGILHTYDANFEIQEKGQSFDIKHAYLIKNQIFENRTIMHLKLVVCILRQNESQSICHLP